MANPPIVGTDQPELLIGSSGDDMIFGNGGDDTLQGGDGNDTLDGGSGNDVLTGGPGTDTLTGGSGADSFRDTAANLNGDHITDFLPGDRIQFTDLNISTAGIHLSGSNLVYNGGSIAIDNLGPGRLVIRAISTGGVEVRLQENAHNDFNGDGRSDILWRGDSGATTDWLGQTTGGMSDNSANFFVNPGASWHIAGTGDFNGDGRVDLLWRNDDGSTTSWLGQANGGFADNSANFFVNPGTSWHIAGTGDFNGDGHDDLLWRNNDGSTTEWLGHANGAITDNAANFFVNPGTSWHIAGTGDFNGDGHDDLLWRNDNGQVTSWLGQDSGGFTDNSANFFVNPGTSWHVGAAGDFNGDGRGDILWRNDDGSTTDWLGQANGGFVDNSANFFVNPGTTWHVAETGDFNGDSIDDILWRNDGGLTTDWLGQTNGSFVDNSAQLAVNPSNQWHVQDPFVHDLFPIA